MEVFGTVKKQVPLLAGPAEQTYVVVDIETIDINVWFSMAFVISRYPSGTIVAMEEMFVDRSGYSIQNQNVRDFWLLHEDAFQHNLHRGIGVSEYAAETHVCNYINELRRKTPHFFLISDNPSFDVRILDSILIKHGHAALSDRGPDLYAQVLDTWSYRLALARVFNTKSPKLFQHPFVANLLADSQISRAVERAVTVKRKQPSLRHTPQHDCCQILTCFFKCLDIAHALSHVVQTALSNQHTQPQQQVQYVQGYRPFIRQTPLSRSAEVFYPHFI